MSVIFGHFAAMFWLGRDIVAHYTGIPEMSAPETIPTITRIVMLPNVNIGAFGVSIFFLISGLVIPMSLTKSSALRFLAARVVRLLPTYVVCFSIVLTAIYVGVWYYNVPWPLKTTQILLHYIPGVRAIGETRDIDGVVWTLEVEVWFYILCALAAPLFRARSLLIFAIPVCLALMSYMNQSLPALFIITRSHHLTFMFVGVAFYFLHSGGLTAKQAVLIFAVTIGSTTVAWLSFMGLDFTLAVGKSYLWGLIVFSLCYRFPRYVPNTKPIRFLADISYPLYLVHAVPGYVIMRMLVDVGGLPRTLILAAGMMLALGLATTIHYLVELPTRKLSGRIQSAPSPHAALSRSTVTPVASAASFQLDPERSIAKPVRS